MSQHQSPAIFRKPPWKLIPSQGRQEAGADVTQAGNCVWLRLERQIAGGEPKGIPECGWVCCRIFPGASQSVSGGSEVKKSLLALRFLGLTATQPRKIPSAPTSEHSKGQAALENSQQSLVLVDIVDKRQTRAAC